MSHLRLLFLIGLLLSVGTVPPAGAQSLESHGAVTEISEDRIVVESDAEIELSEGDRGRVFMTTEVGGDEQSIVAATFRVDLVTGSVIIGELTERSGLVDVEKGQQVSFVDSSGDDPEPTGTLSVQSTPARAEVRVVPIDSSGNTVSGEERVERTPATTTLETGRYRVRMEKDEHEPEEREVTIRAGSSRSIDVQMAARQGRLVVRPVPDTAGVSIDGNSVGQGTIRETLEPGTHEIRVDASGYRPFTDSVRIEPEASQTLSPELEPRTGTLEITSSPAEGTVHVDGSEVGKTPVSTDLDAGTYEVEVSNEGYETVTDSVTVQGGAVQQYEAELQRPIDVKLAASHEGPVGSVEMRRVDRELVIEYSLSGDEPEYEVEVQLSGDGGTSYETIEVGVLTGAVGEQIAPGSDKEIRWRPLEQYPYGLHGDGNRVRVVVEPVSQPGGFTVELQTPSRDVPSFGGATLGWVGEEGYFVLSYSRLSRFSGFSVTTVNSIGVRFGPVWRLGWLSVRPVLGFALRGGDLVGQGGSGVYLGRSFYVGTKYLYSTDFDDGSDWGGFLTVGVSI